MGRYDEAIKDFEKVISIDSEYINATISIGLVKHHLGEYEEAIKYYEKALDIDNSCLHRLTII